jgi:hypothetical protein
MKRHILGLAAIPCLLAVGLIPARADNPTPLEAKIPFAFAVGTATLPAGNYRIEPVSFGSSALMVRNTAGEGAAVILTRPLAAQAAKMIPAQPELVFHKSGTEYRLEEITGPYLQRELAQPSMEREMMQHEMSPAPMTSMDHERVVVRGS